MSNLASRVIFRVEPHVEQRIERLVERLGEKKSEVVRQALLVGLDALEHRARRREMRRSAKDRIGSAT